MHILQLLFSIQKGVILYIFTQVYIYHSLVEFQFYFISLLFLKNLVLCNEHFKITPT